MVIKAISSRPTRIQVVLLIDLISLRVLGFIEILIDFVLWIISKCLGLC